MKTALRRIVAAMIAILSISLLAAPRAEARKTLRILAVGNSFSDDAMEYLPALLESMGIDDVELARLYVGGCSLEQHLRFHVGESRVTSSIVPPRARTDGSNLRRGFRSATRCRSANGT